MATNMAEEASNRATDLRTNFLADLLLLQSLHGILGFAISKAGLDELKPLVCAELAILGLKLCLVSPALCQPEQLDDAILETFAEHLTTTLVLLNEVVAESLVVDYKQFASSKSTWPRLTLLHNIIASRYKAISATGGGKSTMLLDSYFSDDKLCLYLTFNMRIAEQDALLDNLSCLNHDLDELLAAMPGKSWTGIRDEGATEEEEDDDIVLARQAREYRQQISSLYKTLTKNIGACEKQHMAQLCLSNFGIDRNNLDIYVSVCHEPADSVDSVDSQAVTWHPMKCSRKDHAATDSIDGSLCQYLHKARARRLPAMLAYFNETLSEDSIEVNRLPREDLLWSFVDLATVLDETARETITNQQISVAEKLRLQCLLTQSLLFLHPSSWMPETLRLSNIHFIASRPACILKDPYIYCVLQDVHDDYVKLDTDAVADFMIHFGLLLMQIEVGRPLSLLPEEMTDQYGYELALDRYIELFSKDFNIHIQQVLLDCLWFKKRCLGQVPHSKMPLDLKIRFAVSQYILKPLMSSLEFNYPNVAREILPYAIEQHQRPRKVKAKPTSLVYKRKTDNDCERPSRPRTSKVNIGQRDPPSNCLISGREAGGVVVEQSLCLPGKDSAQNNVCRDSDIELTRLKQLEKSRFEQSQPAHPRSISLSTPSRPEDYTVGWISAIPIEKAVACEMLDEEYPRERWPWFDTQRDYNSYTFGCLHGHNIVMACLPKGRYGNASAAVVAQQMRASFPSIRFGLMVGIAGGAPSQKRDIRLGDVVVSSPTPQYCGVIQYDYGKAIRDHDFEETGHMTPPPEMLLNALANLEAQHKRKGHQLAKTVADMLSKTKRLRTECARPADHTDQLYKASYKHYKKDPCACQTLDHQPLSPLTPDADNFPASPDAQGSVFPAKDSQNSISISRDRRAPHQDNIAIHYGLIASANRLMKDADARDVLVQKHDVLCFEMEAAGLVNSFPCVVIRGICDYSDSHKNDLWQGYAAANAAAYAKELLEMIHSHHVKDVKSTP